MALLAWSISFWASPRRLWERFTAWRTHRRFLPTTYNSHLYFIIQIRDMCEVSLILTHQGCDVSMGNIIWILLPRKRQCFHKYTKTTRCKVKRTRLIRDTHIFANTYPTILPFSSSAMYESWNGKTPKGVRDRETYWQRGSSSQRCEPVNRGWTDLGPGQTVVEVVLHLVVFRETQQVTVLHVHQVLRLQGDKTTRTSGRSVTQRKPGLSAVLIVELTYRLRCRAKLTAGAAWLLLPGGFRKHSPSRFVYSCCSVVRGVLLGNRNKLRCTNQSIHNIYRIEFKGSSRYFSPLASREGRTGRSVPQ